MLFQNCSKLASHLARIAGDLTDDVTFESDVITGAVERYSHASPSTLGRDDPRCSYVTSVTRRHNLTASPLSDAPLRRARRVDNSLDFIATGESGRLTDVSTLRRACDGYWLVLLGVKEVDEPLERV